MAFAGNVSGRDCTRDFSCERANVDGVFFESGNSWMEGGMRGLKGRIC